MIGTNFAVNSYSNLSDFRIMGNIKQENVAFYLGTTVLTPLYSFAPSMIYSDFQTGIFTV